MGGWVVEKKKTVGMSYCEGVGGWVGWVTLMVEWVVFNITAYCMVPASRVGMRSSLVCREEEGGWVGGWVGARKVEENKAV